MQRFPAKNRIAIVVNPHTCRGKMAALWRATRERLEQDEIVLAEIETKGDGHNPSRIGKLIADTRPDLVVAAGGDGTVREVVQGLMSGAARGRAAIAIVPLGTANNFARHVGLFSCRHAGRSAAEIALSAIHAREERAIDLGAVDAHYFVGSFALGMDADILRMRNEYTARFAGSRFVRGYPLYLWSCGVNLLTRKHGTRAHLSADGNQIITHAYNLLVTNTSLYAGEFRFGSMESGEDGSLDLHLFAGPLSYFAGFAGAWRRHLRHRPGSTLRTPRKAMHVRSLAVRLDAPIEAQIDGEQMDAIEECTIAVVPRALRVRVPPAPSALAWSEVEETRPRAQQWASAAAH